MAEPLSREERTPLSEGMQLSLCKESLQRAEAALREIAFGHGHADRTRTCHEFAVMHEERARAYFEEAGS